jgi:hypothetical protein
MEHLRYDLLLYLLFILGLLFFHSDLAAAEESLDTVIQGFEEEKKNEPDPQINDLLEGFDDAATDTPFEDDEPSETQRDQGKQWQSEASLDGYLKLGGAWNFAHDPPETGETDWRGLSRFRPEARIDLDAKILPRWRMLIGTKLFYDLAYTLKGRDEFSEEVLDAYEDEVELTEAFVQGRIGRHLDVKAGRQIVVWGRSDNIRITDVLNPLDLREPGLTDIEDLRLPVAMTRLDGYWEAWNLSAIALHEIRLNKSPAFGHDFFPARAPLPDENTPGCGGSDTEWALALTGIFSGKDISFYWADLHNDAAHIEMDRSGRLTREHARVTVWGAAGNLALGNWLLKGEAAYWQDLQFFNVPDRRFDRLDGLLGIEYTGWDETTISVDWAVRHIPDFDRRLTSVPDNAQEDEFQSALRISKDYLNQTLNVTLLAMVYGALGQDGAVERLTLAYDWNDAVSTTLGAALYQSGDRFLFREIGPNDRIFFEIKYSY